MSSDKLKYDLRVWGIRLAFLASGLIIAHHDLHVDFWNFLERQNGFSCSWNDGGFVEKWNPF